MPYAKSQSRQCSPRVADPSGFSGLRRNCHRVLILASTASAPALAASLAAAPAGALGSALDTALGTAALAAIGALGGPVRGGELGGLRRQRLGSGSLLLA